MKSELSSIDLRVVQRLLERAVNPHAFNCGFRQDRKNIKTVFVGGCTCGLSKYLRKGSKHHVE